MLPLTVVVISNSEREVALETCIYFSEICDEVIFVDEQSPFLSKALVKALPSSIKYIEFRDDISPDEYVRVYKKRLKGAAIAKNEFVIHSNHDERYTRLGLIDCLKILQNKPEISFCSGQCVAMRSISKEGVVYFDLSYKNLLNYINVGPVNERVKFRTIKYAPIAHYSLWRKPLLVKALEEHICLNTTFTSRTNADELLFELASDLQGQSLAVNSLLWIRNRVNDPIYSGNKLFKQDDLFNIHEKILFLLKNNSISHDKILVRNLTDHFFHKDMRFDRLYKNSFFGGFTKVSRAFYSLARNKYVRIRLHIKILIRDLALLMRKNYGSLNKTMLDIYLNDIELISLDYQLKIDKDELVGLRNSLSRWLSERYIRI